LSKKVRASWWVGVAALLLLAPFAFSQDSVDLTLINGGNDTMDGIYVGPYNAAQSSNGQPAQNVQIICDDFEHQVSPGESWTATVTSVSSLGSNPQGLTWSNTSAGGSALFGNNNNLTFSTQQGYYAMAYLASQMLPLSGNQANAQQVGYLAYAIWAVFDASAVKSWLGANSNAWAQVQILAENALDGKDGVFSASEFAGWEILTPNCSTHGSCMQGQPQEFLEFVPEGGTALMYLLLGGLTCFGTMFLKSRRRRAISEVV
jgi:hypothetical protein